MVSGVCHNYWYPHQRIEHKKKDTTKVVSFFLVEAGGVEPPSENASSGTSPGADGHLHSLTPA